MGTYSSPKTILEIRAQTLKWDMRCDHCGKSIKAGSRIVALLGHDLDLDMRFGVGFCNLNCLQENFASMYKVDVQGKKWVFITENSYIGGVKFAAEIHVIPESHADDAEQAAWWFLNRISASACLHMMAIPYEKWAGVREAS